MGNSNGTLTVETSFSMGYIGWTYTCYNKVGIGCPSPPNTSLVNNPIRLGSYSCNATIQGDRVTIEASLPYDYDRLTQLNGTGIVLLVLSAIKSPSSAELTNVRVERVTVYNWPPEYWTFENNVRKCNNYQCDKSYSLFFCPISVAANIGGTQVKITRATVSSTEITFAPLEN